MLSRISRSPRHVRPGWTLVEIMIVLIIGILILIPTITMISSTQRSAFKGQGRLDTLSTARMALEKTQRDLKALCYAHAAKAFLVTEQGPVRTYEFASFPTEGFVSASVVKKNPVNRIQYKHDREKNTLTRVVAIHPALLGSYSGPNPLVEVIGRNVIAFSIQDRWLFGALFYDMDIVCQSSHPLQKTEATHLRSAVRSEFEAKMSANRAQIPNRYSDIDVAP